MTTAVHTREDLLAKRAKAVEDYRSILTAANREGRVVTAEERAAADKAQAEAHDYGERVKLIDELDNADASLDEVREQREREAADADVQRSQFVKSVEPSKRSKYNERAHVRWLRGDKSVYHGREIAFTRQDALEGKDTQPVYREVGDGSSDEFRALTTDGVGSGNTSAAATIDSPFIRRLYDFKETYSTFRALMPTRLTTATGASTRWPVVLTHGSAANAADAPLPENTNIGGTDATFGDITFNAYKVGQIQPLSNELRTDNAVDIESWILTELQRNAARQEDRWFILGNGTNMPQGVTNGGFTDAVTTADHEALSYPDLARVVSALDQSYGNLGVHTPQMADGMPGSLKWFMHKSVLTAVWLITNPNGEYMFQPQLSMGVHDTLCGYGIVTSPFLPALAADTTVAYFGSWSDAIIMREAGTTSLVWSDHSSFALDARDYRITCRVDSRVRDAEAVVGLHTEA